MTKKNFSNLTNPADTLIESMDSVNAAEPHKQQAPKGRPSIDAAERRSQHASLLLKPSTANSLKLIAKFEGTSINNIANGLLDKYVADYKKDPAKAKKLEQALKLFS
ncbi:hypothetical protein FEZ37_08645 [Limosilactobacillus fermentum]|jgi:hypothetical protein|uniref:Uncharacterized protein n=1 Tax=Limosilactobacillus fermentum 3872 TaxID=1381124 RepID=A0A806T489_LIMFE|nr:hypothetical protein [Limosilactobacillus fermentum]AKM51087.1 hypothetical protein N573_004900 [Limosilactobacillus fermentum 3872]ARB00539.1 hypothetical protein B5C32_03855 [Limosilactobacillus fermentum]MBD5809118.1 hypothetical protein [Limosilactobacillus fermentum]MBS7689249.1 hypothetical protein [Limosilactobacillus fermentum]MCH5387702.1 hypothetical protein [Limosilactobacillus fermentum]